MRAERLLAILLLLQGHQQLTARELARRLGVSVRTILRDMEVLGTAGIPVVADRGRGGGWSLLEGYRTSLTGLHIDEIRALALAAPPRLLADLGLEGAAEQAALKLLAALPSVRREEARRMRERIHIDGTRWHGTDEDAACLPPLQEAVWQERRIEVDYTRGDGQAVERLLEPLGLVAKGRTWYLIAAVEGDVRTYRVSRIRQVRITEGHFTRPPGFHLADYWEQSTREFVANLPRYPALLRVRQDAVRFIESWRWASIEEAAPPDADGWQVLRLMCEEIEDAAACVLACGGLALVLEPQALADEVRRQAALLCHALGA